VQSKEINFDIDIEKYKKEAKGLIAASNDTKLAGTAKGLEGFTDNPEEASLSEDELRIKGDEKIKGKDKNAKEDKGVREAIDSVKHNNATNPHRSKYTVTKLKNKDFIKKSGAIIENPISGLNVAANADCKIIGGDKGGENVSFEEYWVDVEDSRIKEVQQTCEEDEDQLFHCNRSIKDVNCISKTPCAFDNAEGEGGLYTSSSNRDFASASGGLKWDYKGDILSFGETGKSGTYLYGSLKDESGGCHVKNFDAVFYIKDKKDVSEFRIVQIHENNLLNISVNGHLVRDGSTLGRGDCWHNAGREVWDDVNYDIKHLLVEGENKINIYLRYTKGGHAAVKIKAKRYCCNNWSDEWETDCPVN
jgi:hypothetical protein